MSIIKNIIRSTAHFNNLTVYYLKRVVKNHELELCSSSQLDEDVG